MGWFDFTFSRRCIAVDLGQSRIKAILAERRGSRIEVLHAFTLDLQEEGLLTLEETNRHISRILLEMGDYPVSLVIPQHVAVSHLIALPPEGRGSWERMIEQETQKLIGLSESAIVYDYLRLKPFQRQRNPVWVTVSREKELDDQIKRLHGSGLAVSEVTNTGNALASAYLATQPPAKRVVLVDIGATATTVVLLERLQPVYATAFPFGGELFTEAVAMSRGIPFDEAETIKKTELIFEERAGFPEFIQAVERWHQELQKVLAECLKDPEGPDEERAKVILSGGSSLQPGFLEFLDNRCPFDYHLWRDSTRGVDSQTYAVAYGAALAGLNIAPVKSSLLPKPLRQERFRTVQVALLNTCAGLLLIAIFFVLLTDASARREGLREKMAALQELEKAYEKTGTVQELLTRRNSQYNKIVPIVQQQKRTRDLLKTLALMQEVRAEQEVWFVLLADGKSYFEGGAVSEREAPVRARGSPEPAEIARSETQAPGWNRFVVELSISAEGGKMLEILRNVVNTLGSGSIYRNVDTLAPRERKQLVDPSVTLPERTFSLNLELNSSELPLPAPERKEESLLQQ